jgi:hypothetical protein
MLWELRSGGAGTARGVGERGYAELNGLHAASADLVHLRELGLGARQADFQPFGSAQQRQTRLIDLTKSY